MGVYEIELENLSGYRDYERFMSGAMSLRDLLAIDRLYMDVKRFIQDSQFVLGRADRMDILDMWDRMDEVIENFYFVDSSVGHVIEFEVVNDVYVVTYEEVSRVIHELTTVDRHLLGLKLESIRD